MINKSAYSACKSAIFLNKQAFLGTMKAKIAHFRGGKHTQTNNHMLLVAVGVDNREKASKLVGKEVVFLTEKGNAISGKIASAHGNSGVLRAVFEKGMPGQSIGKEVEIK